MKGLRILKTSGITVLIAGLAAVFAAAQTPKATPTPDTVDDDVIKVESRLVVVPVAVTDANGQPVAGLTAESFKLREEGRPQTIERVSPASAVPLEIALLFDVSASTDAMFKFEQDTAANFLASVMRPQDRAVIFTIGARPMVVHARDNADGAIKAISAVTPTKEFTAFYDTVGAAAEYLKKNAPDGSRRVVLVISDGEDTNSDRIRNALDAGYAKAGNDINKLDQKSLYELTVRTRDTAAIKERVRVLQQLQNADTVFYSVNPAGSSYQLNKMSVFGQDNMEKFAADTGGTAFLPKFAPIDTKDDLQNSSNLRKNTDTLKRIFAQLESEIRSQYLVQYYSEADYPVGRFVKLNVELTAPAGRSLRARQGYYVK